jgi:hypothetical protein
VVSQSIDHSDGLRIPDLNVFVVVIAFADYGYCLIYNINVVAFVFSIDIGFDIVGRHVD